MFLFFLLTYVWVCCQDGVISVVVQRGCRCVQRAGAVRIPADPVVFTPLGDLLTVFKPMDLQGKDAKTQHSSFIVTLIFYEHHVLKVAPDFHMF